MNFSSQCLSQCCVFANMKIREKKSSCSNLFSLNFNPFLVDT